VTSDVDVVIIGAGLAGAATAWATAAPGKDVLVLEQFATAHSHGSSHGSARIVRRAYGDELYTRLTGQAFELWSELERQSSATVLRILGGLDFGPQRNVAAVAQYLAAAGADHEVLAAEEAERRWPGMRFSGDVVHHPQAGTMDPETAIGAFLTMAGTRGARARSGVAATSVRVRDGRAVVSLDDGTELTATTAVIAAGAWVGPLVGTLVALPQLRVTQQQIFHFPRLDLAAPPWPSVIHEDVRPIYHLAGGRDGGPDDDRKIGEHDAGFETSAAGRDGVVQAESRDRVVEYVKRWLPGLDPTPRGEATCLYTQTPTEDFILDRVGPLVICSPCSGHGAKFAPLIGMLAAGLVDGTGEVPARFRLDAHLSGRTGSVSL
jgi:sarcosine oxidase